MHPYFVSCFYLLDLVAVRRCLGRVREWSDTISYMKRCIRTDCQVKERDSRLNSKIK
jgi:hypothetical protein